LERLVEKRKQARRVENGEAAVMIEATLSELIRRITKHDKARLSLSSQRNRQRAFNCFLDYAGDVPVKRSTLETIEGFQGFLLNTGMKPQTVNLAVMLVKSALRKGNAWDMVPDALIKKMSQVKPLKVEEEPKVAMSIEEIEHLLSVASPRWKNLLSVIAYTGCRLMEAYNRKWSDVNLKLNTLLIRKTKTGKGRVIPLLPQARAVFSGMVQSIDHEAYVFMPREKSVSELLKREFKRAKLSQYSTHSLRHTFCSLSIMAGAAEGTVQKILGHQSNAMTKHYTHLSPGFMQAEIARIQGAFENESAKKVQIPLAVISGGMK